jgi:hypothetical protein
MEKTKLLAQEGQNTAAPAEEDIRLRSAILSRSQAEAPAPGTGLRFASGLMAYLARIDH